MAVGRVGLLYLALLLDPVSFTARAAGGDGVTKTEHLLFLTLDELRVANWQRSKDGSKGRNRPKPVSPLAQKETGQRTGHTDLSPGEAASLLASVGARQE